MQAFTDKRGFFLQQPNHVLSRIVDYLEGRGINLTDTDQVELQAIVEGYPSVAARKGYRVVELHPQDVGGEGQILHTVFSRDNATLAWEENYDQAVQVATRFAQKRLCRPVLILDADGKLVQTIDEREDDPGQPYRHAVFVTQGTLYDAEADDPASIAWESSMVDHGMENLRSAYARFNERARRLEGWDRHKGCVLFIVDGRDKTHIVYRRML